MVRVAKSHRRHTKGGVRTRRRNPVLQDMDRNPHIKRELNCSPAVENIKVKNSCYTPHILMQIRNAYNASHSPAEKIHATDPVQIWNVLNKRLVHCKKEDCWLNQITDDTLRKRIDRYIFAPDQPYEWKKNPNEWLSNYDILNVLEQYEEKYKHFEFIGPTPIDFDAVLQSRQCVYNELCHFDLKSLVNKGKTKIGVIFNLDKHDQSGSHWVSLFVDVEERFLFFFDSAGSRCPKPIYTLVKRIKEQALAMGHKYRFYQNYPKTHQYSNTECGVYSLFFTITMLTNKTAFNPHLTLGDKLKLFQTHRIPDKYIERYRHVYFNG
jgi:Ulp1 protease family, C-terminal catalytic domain